MTALALPSPITLATRLLHEHSLFLHEPLLSFELGKDRTQLLLKLETHFGISLSPILRRNSRGDGTGQLRIRRAHLDGKAGELVEPFL